jgi:beta-N-acetylglucosaminidase
MKVKVCFFLICSFLLSLTTVQAGYTEANIKTYEEELARFPKSYQDKIKQLHEIYPNAIFVAQDTFYDWDKKKEVQVKWNEMLAAQKNTSSRKNRSLVNKYDGYKMTESWAYNYYTNTFTNLGGNGWHAANDEAVAYYLDPRNFITESSIFMFESLYYHDYQTKEGVEKILANTFMENKNGYIEYYDTEGKKKRLETTYADIIVKAAKETNISPYFLASRLRQEQGTKGTSSLISGNYGDYKGYYNYFNISASGDTDSEVIKNGLIKAKSEGWTTPEIAIVKGTSFIYKEYVGVNDSRGDYRGQMTNYLQKWDPYGPKYGGHQYMQNIMAPVSEASTTYSAHTKASNYKNTRFIFHIPVYQGMPEETHLPNPGNPNNYLRNLTIDGTTISGFDGAKTSYTYNVAQGTESVNIAVEKVYNKQTVTGTGLVSLSGDTTKVEIVVTAENGSVKKYTILIQRGENVAPSVANIINNLGYRSDGTYLGGLPLGTKVNTLIEAIKSKNASAEVNVASKTGEDLLATNDKITIKSGEDTKTYTYILRGDLDGNGKIELYDLFLIRSEMLANGKVSKEAKIASHVTYNGFSSDEPELMDLFHVRQYLLGRGEITQ